MFWKVRVEECDFIDVSDAVAEAPDVQISLGEGLDVLDDLFVFTH